MASNTESIVLGGGCFWCVEAVFKRIEGVVSARPGYAGGHAENPDYEQVCTGSTGHAEVVEVCFDREIISAEAVLDVFWRAHDPTTLNRQGNDVGSQYRSIILYANKAQKELAEASLAGWAASGISNAPPATQIVPLDRFWPAESHHEDYFDSNRGQAYCRLVILPKLRKLDLRTD